MAGTAEQFLDGGGRGGGGILKALKALEVKSNLLFAVYKTFLTNSYKILIIVTYRLARFGILLVKVPGTFSILLPCKLLKKLQ